MKRAKKLLVTLLILTFVLSAMSIGFAAEEKLPSEVVRAKALGILKGDDQGNLNLDKPITRAEALALVIRISGLESSAELMKGQTRFSDVGTDPGLEWATGYINLGVGQDIINGYPDGTFRGRNTVTYAEMAKMILYAMNYGVTVEGAPWPAGVMGKADDLDMFDGVNALPNIPAVRGDVVKIIDNSLEINHLKQTGFGDFKQYEEDIGKTFLSKLKVEEKDEVVVTDIPRTDDKLKKNEIKLDGKKYKVLADVDFEELFGQEVTVFLNKDDEIISIEIDSEFYYDALKEVTKKKLKLVDAGDKYDIDAKAVVYIDGEKEDLDALSDEYDYAKVVLNDDGDVAFIDAYSWDGFLVVEEVDDDVLYAYDEELDIEDFTIVKDGKAIDADDLEEGDIFFYNEGAEFAEVFNKTVEGKVKRVFTDKMEVNGKDYKFGSAKYLDGSKLVNFDEVAADEMREEGEEVTLFLSRAGDLVFVIGERGEVETGTVVGYLYKDLDKIKVGRDTLYYIDIVNENGEVVNYEVDVEDVDKGNFSSNSDSKVLDKGQLVKLDIDSDGDVVGIWKADEDEDDFKAEEFDSDYETDDKYINGYRVKSSTVVFLVQKFLEDGDKKDIKVVKWGDIEDFEKIHEEITIDDQAVKSVVYYNDKNYATYIVAVKTDVDEETDDYTAVITGIDELKGNKNEYRITAFVDGKEETFYTKKDPKGNGNNGVFEFKMNNDKFKLGVIKVNKSTGLVDEVEKLDGNEDYVEVTVEGRSVSSKTITVGSDDYRLVDDSYVFDALKKDVKKATLRDISEGDKVVLVLDAKGTKFVKYVILTDDKSGDNGEDEKPEGAVEYKGTVELDGNTYITLGDNTYPFTGELPGGIKKGDYVIATFVTIRGELVVTEIKLADEG